jgi:hypothetical protein
VSPLLTSNGVIDRMPLKASAIKERLDAATATTSVVFPRDYSERVKAGNQIRAVQSRYYPAANTRPLLQALDASD